MRFLGGFYVFPGGTVHREDYSAAMLRRCRRLTGTEAPRILGGRHEADEAIAIGSRVSAAMLASKGTEYMQNLNAL